MYGEITINGKTYVEREITLIHSQVITQANQVVRNQNVQLPGTAPFVLKAMTRCTIQNSNGADITATQRFRFKFGNSDGNIWFVIPGVGGTNDRAVDTLIFGPNVAFPKIVVPYVFYTTNATIPYEVEDIAMANAYTIHFGFIGTFLNS